jgi:hypothetical protein
LDGNLRKLKLGICVATINDYKVGSFSDISLEYKISSHGQIYCRDQQLRAVTDRLDVSAILK